MWIPAYPTLGDDSVHGRSLAVQVEGSRPLRTESVAFPASCLVQASSTANDGLGGLGGKGCDVALAARPRRA